jgi:lysophospholipase L1-like esterase
MAEQVLHPDPGSFPPGTAVKVYLRAWPEPGGVLAGAPAGSVLSEPVVAEAGTLRVTGLEEGRGYIGWAVTGGVDRYVRFEAGGTQGGVAFLGADGTVGGTGGSRLSPSVGISSGVRFGNNLGIPAVATKPRAFTQATADNSDGVLLSRTFVLAHKMTTAARGLRLVYQNWRWEGSREVAGLNSITVGASLELPNGVGGQAFMPVTFSGADTVVIPPDGTVISDPIEKVINAGNPQPLALVAGSVFRTRTWVGAASGAKWPLSSPAMTGNSGGGSNVELGSEGTADNTDLRLTAGGWLYSTSYAYGPSAILASYSGIQRPPSIALVGDSILNGFEDGGLYGGGVFLRGLGTTVGYINVACDGEKAANFINSAGSGGLTCWRRLKLIDGCTHAILGLGRNDLTVGTTAATIEAQLTGIATELTARGMKVYLATVLPSSTSTDGYVTVGNQTAAADNHQRVLLNAWIRSVPSPAFNYIEQADLVESARDSGLWKAGYTSAGIHPNATGAAAAGSVFAAKLPVWS